MMNGKQLQFIDEYARDWNATQAAIRAGYSRNGAEVQGHRLLRNAKVRQAIERKRAETTKKYEITVDGLTADLMAMRDLAYKERQSGAGVQALMGIAKLHGLIIDKAHVEGGLQAQIFGLIAGLGKPDTVVEPYCAPHERVGKPDVEPSDEGEEMKVVGEGYGG